MEETTNIAENLSEVEKPEIEAVGSPETESSESIGTGNSSEAPESPEAEDYGVSTDSEAATTEYGEPPEDGTPETETRTDTGTETKTETGTETETDAGTEIETETGTDGTVTDTRTAGNDGTRGEPSDPYAETLEVLYSSLNEQLAEDRECRQEYHSTMLGYADSINHCCTIAIGLCFALLLCAGITCGALFAHSVWTKFK